MNSRLAASRGGAPLGADRSKCEPRLPGWLGQTMLVFKKDLLIELNSGEIITTSVFFSFLVVVLASLSFYGGPTTARLVASGALWLSVTFAAVLALGRAWQRERDEGALEALLVAPVARSAIFAGKALVVSVFMLVVEAVVVPVIAVLFALDLTEVGFPLLLIALVATPGIAASGTLFGAMTVRTQARDVILAIVLFPLLSPTLLAAVAGTRELLQGADFAALWDYFQLMAVFDVVFVLGGLGLFGLLMET